MTAQGTAEGHNSAFTLGSAPCIGAAPLSKRLSCLGSPLDDMCLDSLVQHVGVCASGLGRGSGLQKKKRSLKGASPTSSWLA